MVPQFQSNGLSYSSDNQWHITYPKQDKNTYMYNNRISWITMHGSKKTYYFIYYGLSYSSYHQWHITYLKQDKNTCIYNNKISWITMHGSKKTYYFIYYYIQERWKIREVVPTHLFDVEILKHKLQDNSCRMP